MRNAILHFFIFLYLYLLPHTVFGQCVTRITPSSVAGGSVGQLFTISVQNIGNSPIQTVTIPTNLGGYIYVTETVSTGWDKTSVGGGDMFSNNTIEPGTFGEFLVTGNTAGGNYDFMWTVESSEATCNAVPISITFLETPTPTPIPEAVSNPPTISSIAVSANSSTATITWNLDGSATTTVFYGRTNEYGSSISTTDESPEEVSLTGLSASTTYHYQIQSTNRGGTTSSIDAIFTTASSASNTTTTTTTTVNTTSTITNTVVLSDINNPTVTITSKLNKIYTQPPMIEGVVVDTGAIRPGVSKIQYSIDGGKNWLFILDPPGAIRTPFSFVPEVFEDGNYVIKVRAVDRSGNIGVSSSITLVIDRLPPKIIHSLWHVGPIILSPNSYGERELVVGVPTQVVVQGIGGITKMNLTLEKNSIPFKKNSETGLWEGIITLSEGGRWDSYIQAEDGGGGVISEKIGVVSAQSTQHIVPSQSAVSVWKYTSLEGHYTLWNGSAYGQSNPQIGKTAWFLPAGTYYFHVSAPGYTSSVSTIFTLVQSGPVVFNTKLSPRSIWGMLGWMEEFQIQSSSNKNIDSKTISNIPLTWIESKTYKGKSTVLSIIPAWDPRASSLFLHLYQQSLQSDKQYIVILPGSNNSSINSLKKKGNYNLVFEADPDGEILEQIKGIPLPFSADVNSRGVIEKVLY